MPHRPEIDGLRFAAVTSVILYHIESTIPSGGFLGVDAFFVISGYLIYKVIIGDFDAGIFSLVRFYERHARRILPALFVVVFSCAIAAFFILAPTDMKEFSQSLIALALFSQNILFWQQSGYFASEQKLLLHTWSLAIEEQFYLIFPVIMYLLLRFRRQWIPAALSGGFVFSLLAAQWGTTVAPDANFYLLPGRVWEFTAGALAAWISGTSVFQSAAFRRSNVKNVAASIGIVLLIASLVVLRSDMPHPGVYTLWIVLGTSLILLFGDAETWIGRILGFRIFAFVGRISYSLYLWHQPVIIFARYWNILPLASAQFIPLLTLILLLSVLSWRFVEEPFRTGRLGTRRQVFFALACISVVWVGMGGAGIATNGHEYRYGKAAVFMNDDFTNFSRPMVARKCRVKLVATNWKEPCIFGSMNESNAPTIALFGDSHALTLAAAFDTLGKSHGKSIIHFSHPGCPPLFRVDVEHQGVDSIRCSTVVRNEFEWLKNSRVRHVFLVARWTSYSGGNVLNASNTHSTDDARTLFAQGLAETVLAYEELGMDVHVVLQVPEQIIEPVKLYNRIYLDFSPDTAKWEKVVREYSVSSAAHREQQHAYRQIVMDVLGNAPRRWIDLDGYFCDWDRCMVGTSQRSYYYDTNHLSTYGVERITAAFERYFE